MKIINNQSAGYNAMPNEQPTELKEGEVYSARIKERISDNEAIIQVKGKEVRATFEGKVPLGDRASVQVTGNSENRVQVRAVPDLSKDVQPESQVPALPREIGSDASGINRAVKLLQDKGISVDKETFQQLKKFFESVSGNLQQKLETVQALVNNKVAVSMATLTSVHAALHGKPFIEVFGNLAGAADTGRETGKLDTLNGKSNVGNARTAVNLLLQIKEMIANESDPERILQVLRSLVEGKGNQGLGVASAALQDTAEKLLTLLQQQAGPIDRDEIARKLEQMINPARKSAALFPVLASLKENIQQDQSLDKAIQQMKATLQTIPATEKGMFAGVEKALAEAERLEKVGWNGLGRERIQKAINQMETEQAAVSSDMSITGWEQMPQHSLAGYEESQMSSMLTSKDLIVTEITKRLREAAIQFKNTKREMVRNMDNIIHVAQNTRANVMPAIKPLLETTIDLLDKTILKSDITMLTDMESEKELMQASTQLAAARKHLAKGENSQAVAVLQEVKVKLESMNWRPSNVRVQHFLTGNSLFMDETTSVHQLSSKMIDVTTHFQQHEPSARNMYEFIRSLGLNHDSEVAQVLSASRDGSVPTHIHQNMKAALLHLAKSEGEQGHIQNMHPQVEQALANLTGQQLLSKSDPGSNLQSMFFNLPLMLGGKLENVKLYINSKDEGQKIDWENCSLFFMIETKKLGPTGILLSAADRNLSITVKNDNRLLKEKLEPLVNKCKDNLKELGYNITGVKFAPLAAQENREPASVEKTVSRSPQPNPAAKGFDFKI